MLKLGKGLKKKKKNKKGKKNEELYTEEELEKYRQEHAHKAEEPGPSEEGGAKPGNEELEKFKLLTAGVDDILRKSQGDLDRIKKDSFFQRKLTPSQIKAAEEQERAEREKSEGNWVGFEEGKGPEQPSQFLEVHAEEDSESEYEDNDDIFDTAYVDALESGEVKLAYVPDDDELGLNDGPDPFDTSTADIILRKAEEDDRKKKKEVSLGLAVNVLTGRAERDKALLDDPTETKQVRQVRARPRKIQDLCLLGSFDETTKEDKPEAPESSATHVTEAAPALFSLLDEELTVEGDLPEGDILITEVLVKQVARPPPPEFATPEENEQDLKDLVTEFEFGPPPVDPEIKKLEEEEEFDEFSALAASSVINQKLEQELQQFEVEEDDPFDTTDAEVVLRTEPDPFESIEGQSRHLPLQAPQVPAAAWSAFDESPKEVDPFDTGFVDKCVPGKVELRLLEKEILGAPVPQAANRVDVHLEARILSRNNSEDFNPRAGEERSKSQRVSIQITDPSGETQRGSESEEIVALSLSHRDLLGGSTTDLSSLGDQPLPPNSGGASDDIDRYSDPFDTSLADQATAPGRAELKYIETELLSDIREVLEDEDFDPRSADKESRGVSFDIPSPLDPDLLASVKEEAGARPLTPYYADPISAESDLDLEVEDPFDTSHVTSLPGKQELKLIEQALEQAPTQPAVFQPIHEKLGINPDVLEGGLKHSLSDQDFNPRVEDSQLEVVQPAPIRRFSDISGLHHPPQSLPLRSSFSDDKPDLLTVEEEELPVKALTPSKEEDLSKYVDPFDTTIAEDIAPGKAELKVLEVELVGSISRSYTDPDFNPRDAPVTEGKLKTVPSTQPLEPVEVTEEVEDIDPFDTSFASNLAPGKTELRLLESELVGQ